MHDPVDVLERQLIGAAERLQRPLWHSWRLRSDRRARIIVVAALSVVIVTPAIAAITQTWPGDLDRGTATAPRVQIPVSNGNLEARLADSFAVLKRPKADADALPAGASLPPLASGVQLDATRRLAVTAQGSIYLVPVDAVLARPLQVLPDQRSGPPGLCLATTGNAPASMSCVSTHQLLEPGAGLSIQLAACAPNTPADTIRVQALAVDQVTNLTARLADGTATALEVRDNLINSVFARTNTPKSVDWSFNGRPYTRSLDIPSQLSSCEPTRAPS
jgi:hypothetical protein